MMNEPVTQRYLEESQVVVQPSSATPEPDFQRRKRARCGTCSSCMNRDKNQDCRQCRNCLDQKRYGGPGRIKKACCKRQCAVVSQMIAAETSLNQKPAVRRAYGRPLSPKTEDGKSIRKDMSLDSSREDLSDGSTGGTNRGAPRPHVPQAPPPVLEREFRGDKRQEPPKDLGYNIKLE